MGSAADNIMNDEGTSDLPIARPSTEIAKRSLLGAGAELPLPVRAELLRVLDSYIRQNQVKRLVDLIARKRAEFGFRSVAVLSHDTGEGRTFFTAALSRSLAEFLRARVLVVDASGRGVVEPLLAALGDGSQGRKAERGSIGFCDVVTLGDVNNHDRMSNEFQFGEMVRHCEEDYDIVIADTQALSVSGAHGCDAALIAQQVDAYILLVTDPSVTSESQKNYLEQLGTISTPCVGVVHNPKK